MGVFGVNIPAALLVHSVTVTPKSGESSTGVLYGTPFALGCFRSGKRRLVRNAEGNQVLSTLTLVAAPGQAEAIPPGSLVTFDGHTTTVVAAINQDSGGLGAPDHTEVQCE
jgi:hypothetical protein